MTILCPIAIFFIGCASTNTTDDLPSTDSESQITGTSSDQNDPDYNILFESLIPSGLKIDFVIPFHFYLEDCLDTIILGLNPEITDNSGTPVTPRIQVWSIGNDNESPVLVQEFSYREQYEASLNDPFLIEDMGLMKVDGKSCIYALVYISSWAPFVLELRESPARCKFQFSTQAVHTDCYHVWWLDIDSETTCRIAYCDMPGDDNNTAEKSIIVFVNNIDGSFESVTYPLNGLFTEDEIAEANPAYRNLQGLENLVNQYLTASNDWMSALVMHNLNVNFTGTNPDGSRYYRFFVDSMEGWVDTTPQHALQVEN